MNNISEINRWLDDGTLFLRYVDKEKIIEVPNILAGPAPYIALTSSRPKLLNHYFNYLYECIRQDYRFEVEVFFSVTVDSILEFYNSRLSDVSLTSAREEKDEATGRKIMVIADSASMSEQERDLLERLLVDFPGANCGLLLVSEKLHSEFSEKFLNNNRLKLNVLNVDFPLENELEDIVNASVKASDGHDLRTEKLKELGLSLPESAAEGMIASEEKEDPVFIERGQPPKNKVRARFFWGLGFSAVAAAGIGIGLNEDIVNRILMEESLNGEEQYYSGEVLPGLNKEEENNFSEMSEREGASQTEDDFPAEEDNFALTESTEDMIVPNDISYAADSRNSEGESTIPEGETNGALELNQDSEEGATLKSAASLSSDRKDIAAETLPDTAGLKQEIDVDGFYIQHGAYQLEENALNALTWTKRSFSLAFVIRQKMSGSDWYVIVSGNYDSREQAEQLSKEKRPSADVWIITGELVVSRSSPN